MRTNHVMYMIAVLLAFLVVGCLQDSGTITGTVSDAGGSPVGGAIVSVDPYNYAAVAGTDGSYSIESVPLGAYTVNATSGALAGSTDVTVIDESASCAPTEITADITIQ